MFDSKEQFTHTYQLLNENLIAAPDKTAKDLYDQLYSKGFQSLYPVVDNMDTYGILESAYENTSNSLIEKSVSSIDAMEHFDDLEDVLGEASFSALLNSQAEIQIGTKILKYTDTGLFMIEAPNYSVLYPYLNEKGISSDLLVPTNPIVVTDFISSLNPCGGIVQLPAVLTLEHFVAPNVDCDPVSGGGNYTGGGSSGGGSGSNASTDDHYLASRSLSECTGTKPLIGNIFGTTMVCIDRYNARRRVKTKYYDIDVFLAFAMGIKVKHQFRTGSRFWDKERITEMGMGLNAITWKFTPQIYNTVGVIPQSHTTIFIDGENYASVQDWLSRTTAQSSPLPNLPFNENDLDVIIEIASQIPFANLDNERDVTEFVYSTLFDQIASNFSSMQGRELKKAGIVLKSGQEIWVQYYNLQQKCNNCSKIEKVIDWGIITPLITYKFGPGAPTAIEDRFSYDVDFNFRNPEAMEVSGYGMARSGTHPWHGNRVTFSD